MIVVICLIVYMVIASLVFFFRSYKKDLLVQLKKEEHPFFFLYSFSLVISDYFLSKNPQNIEKKKIQLREIYVREDLDVCYAAFCAKRITLFLVLMLAVNTLVLLVSITSTTLSQLQENGVIVRPTYGQPSKMVDVRVAVEEEGIYVEEDMVLEVAPRQYTQETFQEDLKKAYEYLEQSVIGENSSKDEIRTQLNLVEWVPETGIYVTWNLYEQEVINSDGTLQLEEIYEITQIVLEANLKTEEGFKATYEMPLSIYPRELTREEQIRWNLSKELEKSTTDHKTEEHIVLPTTVGDSQVHIEEVKVNSIVSIIVLGSIIGVLLLLVSEEQVVKKTQEREEQILFDYPELVNKFSLLLGAGMTIKKAWEKVVMEYMDKLSHGKKKRYAYEEMVVTWNEIKNGVNEVHAYENFGRRMRIAKYLKFSSLLAQYSTRGMDGLLSSLEYEAVDAFENRKELAKCYGEKASTKLLAPMMIMLILVLLMILVPVAVSF